MDQFAGLHVVDEAGADDVEAAGLAAGHPLALLRFPQQSEHQGTDAMAVAQGEKAVGGADHQAEGPAAAGRPAARIAAFQPRPGIHLLLQGESDQFGIGGGGEFTGQVIQGGTQLRGIDQIAVVGQGERAQAGHQQHGLGIADLAAAGGGIAVVADGQLARHALQHLLVKHLAHQAHVLVQAHPGLVEDGDSCRFLAPVLQGVEAEVGEVGHRLAWGQHGEDTARLLGLVGAVEDGGSDGRGKVDAGRVQGTGPIAAFSEGHGASDHRSIVIFAHHLSGGGPAFRKRPGIACS